MRILHIMGSADAGGVEMVVYNYMKYIDQQRFHFDFALTGHQPGMLGKKMIDSGAHFYPLPLKSNGILAFEKALKDLLTKERFDAVHVHGNSTSYVALRVAKRCGIPCRISHAHTAGKPNRLKDWLIIQSGHILNKYYATHLIACGSKAGELVFGSNAMKTKKAVVLPNSIESDLFCFNPVIREQVRKELNIGNRYAIGIVGRLDPQKNYSFILPVIKKLHNQTSDFSLIIVGSGSQEDDLRKYCNVNQMNDYVHFIGVRNDIERIYQGLDVFILPSLYEGFPVAALEAIAAGLPVLLSDRITPELNFFKTVEYIPLVEKKWVEVLTNRPINNARENGEYEIKKYHFDIKDTAGILQSIYESAKRENETDYVV